MTQSRKIVFEKTLIILIGELMAAALMCAVYALLGRFGIDVLLGGLIGTVVATGNFFFMAVAATLAADRAENQDVDGGKKLLKLSYPMRLLMMGAILVLCAASGWFNVLALVLPLVFLRPILTLAELFKKEGA